MAAGSKKLILAGIVVMSVSMASAFGLYFFRQAMENPGLPVIGQIDHFILSDSHGRDFDSQFLYRNVWIAGRFSLPCKDACADMMKNMASLSRTFEQISAVKLITISGPSGNVGAEDLAAYQDTLVMGKGNWFFLTGPARVPESALSQQLGAEIPLPQIAEGQQLTLVDRSGYIRGYYNGTQTDDVNQLFLDASKLLKERF